MQEENARTIVKYSNRMLYDTRRRCYITLRDVLDLVKDRVDVTIIDHKSKKDITHAILLQLLTNHEQGSQPVLTGEFLRELIRFLDDRASEALGSYLDKCLALLIEGSRAYSSTI
jgi:polyhydroxyalkanoate synthesis repressor PhaR